MSIACCNVLYVCSLIAVATFETYTFLNSKPIQQIKYRSGSAVPYKVGSPFHWNICPLGMSQVGKQDLTIPSWKNLSQIVYPKL